MSLTTITTAPTAEDFTPLSEHHEQTPGSFFAGKPVLHLQAPASKLQISKDELEANEPVKALVATTDDAAVNAEGFVEIQNIDVWVTSRYDCRRNAASALLFQLSNAQTTQTPDTMVADDKQGRPNHLPNHHSARASRRRSPARTQPLRF